MDREKMIQDILNRLNNMNDDGLDMAYRAVDGLDDIELYNINTTPERQAEIKAERKERRMREEKEPEAKRKADVFDRMKADHIRKENMIANLTGKEKSFYKHITDVRKKAVSSCMTALQLKLLADIHNNNLINGSYDIFCFGFYQGMKYSKKLHKCNQAAAS